MSLYRGLFLLLLLASIISCQNQSGTDSSGIAPNSPSVIETTAPQRAENGYPVPQGLTDAYPGSSANVAAAVMTRTPVPTIDPALPIPAPEPGMATLHGYVISSETNEPLIDLPVSLAEIYRNAENQGAFVYDTAFSPLTFTDGNGRFIFTNVEAKEYVIVVGSVEVNRYEIVADDDGAGATFQLQADMITDVGTLLVGIDW